MRTSFDLVHVQRDGSELRVGSAKSMAEVSYLADSSQYIGTWISDTVKVLRYGRGEIHVRSVQSPMLVISSTYIREFGEHKIKLKVANSDVISHIMVSRVCVETYDRKNKLLEVYYTFTELAERVEKEIAFECFEFHEKLCTTYQLESAMQ